MTYKNSKVNLRKMQEALPGMKKALEKAVKAKNHKKTMALCKEHCALFRKLNEWPDELHLWTRAYSDAQWALGISGKVPF